MNEKKTPAEHPPIRMLFELDRADDPFLYDDLMRCRKGTRRANRLRLLAHEGVVAQLHLANVGRPPGSTRLRLLPRHPLSSRLKSRWRWPPMCSAIRSQRADAWSAST